MSTKTFEVKQGYVVGETFQLPVKRLVGGILRRRRADCCYASIMLDGVTIIDQGSPEVFDELKKLQIQLHLTEEL